MANKDRTPNTPLNKNDQENNAVYTDQELQNGEHPIGRVVHLSTVTHAFRGVLRDVTTSYFILDNSKPAHIIHDTGEVSAYSKTGKTDAREMEEVNKSAEIRIPRGSVAWMLVWD